MQRHGQESLGIAGVELGGQPLGLTTEDQHHPARFPTSRPGETEGVDYNFISRARFEELIAAGAFLEWADVFGHYYGTGSADTETALAAGEDLVLVIDVQGARQVRGFGRDTVDIFVLPPSAAVLERRLRGRSGDDEEQIRTRLRVARSEVGEYSGYEYVVVNDELDTAVERLRAIVLAERARVARMRGTAAAVVETFRQG
jgi:guanylate kinase